MPDFRISNRFSAFAANRFDLIIDASGEGIAKEAVLLLAPAGYYVATGGHSLNIPAAPMFAIGNQVYLANAQLDGLRSGEKTSEILERLLVAAANGTLTVPSDNLCSWVNVDAVFQGYATDSQ